MEIDHQSNIQEFCSLTKMRLNKGPDRLKTFA
ncbi:hypothetical protein AAZX31_08G295500 [Glycine max]